MVRVWCRLFGCQWGDNARYPRCDMHGYDDFDFIQQGLLHLLTHRWWLMRKWIHFRTPWRRCDQCRRRLWTLETRRSFCSKACLDEWLPF